jgi:hypothetical protein
MVRKELGPPNNQLNKEGIDIACSMHGGITKLIQIFDWNESE